MVHQPTRRQVVSEPLRVLLAECGGRCTDMHFRPRRGEEFSLPGGGVRAARDDCSRAAQVEEDRPHRRRRGAFIRLSGDDMHR